VDGVAARARPPGLEVLEVMPGVVVTFQASFPALFDADPLDAGLSLRIFRVLDVRSPRPVARLVAVIRDCIEVLVGGACQQVFVAGMTPGAHLTSDVRIRLLCGQESRHTSLRRRGFGQTKTHQAGQKESGSRHSDDFECDGRTRESM
jgi:hypothetical protein